MENSYSNYILFLYFLPFFIVQVVGLYKMFRKADVEGWKAIIPVYNYWVWVTVIGRPWWWFLLLFVPIINVLVYLGMLVEMAKVFGKFNFSSHVLAVLVNPFYFLYLGFSESEIYIGPDRVEAYKQKHPKSSTREWVDAIAFAVIAASIIRGFFIEAFTIPTSSMERSLLKGDFLFVSKVHYGSRIPQTPLSFPFTHNTMPVFKTKSYLEWIQLPYMRFPGFETIENGDIVVFNYPGDLKRPVDKRKNYIKRCVGIPGDSLAVKEAQVYINGEKAPKRETYQYAYKVKTNGQLLPGDYLQKDLKVEIDKVFPNKGEYYMNMTEGSAEKLRNLSYVNYVKKQLSAKNRRGMTVYPNHYRRVQWNRDHYGPVYIPEEGDTIKLNRHNYKMYKTPIENYEHHKMHWKDGQAYLDGNKADEYIFKMNYYFMMGDNRHNSQDSRAWGFVPEDHIVGKALFLWMSWDSNGPFYKFWNRIRWERLFTPIHSGEIK